MNKMVFTLISIIAICSTLPAIASEEQLKKVEDGLHAKELSPKKSALELLKKILPSYKDYSVFERAIAAAFADKQPEIHTKASNIISAQGKKSVPVLRNLLTNKNPQVRILSLYTLANIRKNAVSAVPDIVSLLKKDEDVNVRVQACVALGSIKIASPAVMEALRSRLDDDVNVVYMAINAIKDITMSNLKSTRLFLPLVRSLKKVAARKDENKKVRDQAESAFKMIEGQMQASKIKGFKTKDMRALLVPMDDTGHQPKNLILSSFGKRQGMSLSGDFSNVVFVVHRRSNKNGLTLGVQKSANGKQHVILTRPLKDPEFIVVSDDLTIYPENITKVEKKGPFVTIKVNTKVGDKNLAAGAAIVLERSNGEIIKKTTDKNGEAIFLLSEFKDNRMVLRVNNQTGQIWEHKIYNSMRGAVPGIVIYYVSVPF